MKNFWTTAAKAVILAALIATPAAAAPINPLNAGRPVAIGSSSEPSLQRILDTLFGCGGCVDDFSGQQNVGMWGTSIFGPIAFPMLSFEFAGNAAINTFGIWSGTDTTAVTRVPIFLGGATGFNNGVFATFASLYWTPDGNFNVFGPDCGVKVNCTTTQNINSGAFGFYIDAADGTYYTVDQLNSPAEPQILSYAQGNQWVLAFEDFRNSDRDFNDGIIQVTNLRPIPEPGSLALLAMGLFGVAGAARRRKSRREQKTT